MPDAANVKVRLKLGPVELLYEGSEDFLVNQVPELLETIAALYKVEVHDEVAADEGSFGRSDPVRNLQLTTSSVAAKLNASTGPELIIAAAIRMNVVLKKATFTREELLAEMKTASAYYKKTYSNNLTSYLNRLVKDGQLVESAKNVYALSADERDNLEKKIAS